MTDNARETAGRTYSCTPAQRRIWVFQQRFPLSNAYHVCGTLSTQGLPKLDRAGLEAAIGPLAQRHSALRTCVRQIDGQIMQVVASRPSLDIREVSCTDDASAREAESRFSREPFALEDGPLFRLLLVNTGPSQRMVWVFHHIICDGASLSILSDELRLVLCNPGGFRDLPACGQFTDFLQPSRPTEAARRHWLSQLEDFPPPVVLPQDFHGGDMALRKSGTYGAVIDEDLVRRLDDARGPHNASRFVMLLAAFALLLSKVSRQQDLVIGVPLVGRLEKARRNVVGHFINITPVRVRLAGCDSLARLVAQVRAALHGAIRHQEYPMELALDAAGLKDWAGFPGTPALFNMPLLGEYASGILDLQPGHGESGTDPKLPWDWWVLPQKQGFSVHVQYDSAMFAPATVEYLAGQYLGLLERISQGQALSRDFIDAPLMPLDKAPPLPRAIASRPATRAIPVTQAIQSSRHAGATLVSRFLDTARTFPGRTAVRDPHGRMTYAQLDTERQRVMELLSAARRGSRVGLLLAASCAMPAAILGALSLGMTYVPLDPAYPRPRLEHMLRDSGVETLVVDRAHHALALQLLQRLEAPRRPQLVELDGPTPVPFVPAPGMGLDLSQAEAAAYILYTSGSSGVPKGVVQSHRNALYHVDCYIASLRLGEADNLSLLGSYAFDASIMDIFGALLSGACLCVCRLEEQGLREVVRSIAAWEMTVVHATPTLLRTLFSQDAWVGDAPPGVRALVFGGETLTRADVELARAHMPPDCAMVNGLGPTEATVALQFRFDSHQSSLPTLIPVGHPVGTTSVDLVDEGGVVEGVFATGEIVIRSDHVALEYLGLPDETRRAFGVDAKGLRFYRTGDHAQRWMDGSLRPLGRRDRQIKIRGVRVELDETEAIMRAHPDVKDCICLAQAAEDGTLAIAAYVVPRDTAILSHASLQDFAMEQLVRAAQPQTWALLSELPKTPSGKLDRKALALAQATRLALDADVDHAPLEQDGLDEQTMAVLDLMKKLLGHEHIRARTNFFRAGGNSLIAMTLIARLSHAFGVNVPVRTFFEEPTALALGRLVSRHRVLSGRAASPEGGPALESHVF